MSGRQHQIGGDFRFPSVSFFCPAYHDEGNLPRLIPEVWNFLKENSNIFEIIIVEDGSPDKTGDVADDLALKFPNVRVIHHPKNKGYGETLKDGFLNSKYEYIMYTDGDAQYDIREFKPYLYLLSEHDIIAGYATKKAVTFSRKIQSAFFNFLILLLFFVRFKDINCSMKIFKRKVIDSLEIKSGSAFIDAEMLIKAKRLGFKIAQFPVTHFKRAHGLASGSKPSVIFQTIKDMIKLKFRIL